VVGCATKVAITVAPRLEGVAGLCRAWLGYRDPGDPFPFSLIPAAAYDGARVTGGLPDRRLERMLREVDLELAVTHLPPLPKHVAVFSRTHPRVRGWAAALTCQLATRCWGEWQVWLERYEQSRDERGRWHTVGRPLDDLLDQAAVLMAAWLGDEWC